MDELIDMLKNDGVIHTPHIEAAFRDIDRADFVPEEYRHEAYVDTALPIGHEQTISQPYTVAFMFELLQPGNSESILDVGSGSGWTTALLGHIVGEKGRVCGVERVPELVTMGQQNIAKYQLPQASIQEAGEEFGLPSEAPFDRILVSATAQSVPDELITQLRDGGVMVLPVHDALWKVTKKTGKDVSIDKHEGFVFVPLLPKKT